VLSEADITVDFVNGPTAAEIIDAFLARASRVVHSELVDATKVKFSEGYRFDVHMMKDGSTEVSWQADNEYYMKGLAADLRPFLPWVDDATSLPRVMNAVLRSLDDPQWKRTMIWFKDEYGKLVKYELSRSYWSSPSINWQMSMSDMELAKMVLNSQWFHEGLDPKIRHLLNSDYQALPNYQAVSRLLNNTILGVTLLQRFIVDADDAGALKPATR
jgi:hypothetical protein